jgi:hypothetical protein
MDITTLPYETQFKILLSLPPADISNYCNSNTVTATICGTYAFWNLKAKRDFGFSLDMVPGTLTYMEKYNIVRYKDRLLSYLVDNREFALFADAWAIIRAKTDPNKNIVYQYLLQHTLNDIANIDEDDIILAFLQILEPYLAELKDGKRKRDIIRTIYFAAVLKDMDDVVALLDKYYDWQLDLNNKDLREWITEWDYYDDPVILEKLAKIGLVPGDIV